MIYLDSNIFIKALLNTGELGEKARSFLEDVNERRTLACTSYLTWDEISWAILKNRGFEKALEAGKAFLSISNLRFVEVDRSVLEVATKIMGDYKIHPRDAIHASSAIKMGADILSEDKDFDKIKELSRKEL